jgi:cell division protein FtsA
VSSKNIVTGIDIGNSAVKTVIAEVDESGLAPRVLGWGSVPSNGLRRGVVYDMEETTANIRDSVAEAEKMAGIKVERAFISLNGPHIRTQQSRGVIVVSRADNEISRNDIDRVIDAAAIISLPPNREIIHVISKSFTIDSQEKVKNALGMKGVRLEADVILIEGLSPYIRNLAKCASSNNIEVAGFVFAPLAVAKFALDKHQREHGVLNVDFGGGISTVALFQEGELIHAAILPVGSKHITNDIAVAFRTTIEKAEEIKCKYGMVGAEEGGKKDQIDLSQLLDEDDAIVPRRQIGRIIDCRVSELFDFIGEEMKKVPQYVSLPAGVVLTGGGANLAGLANFAKNRLRLSVGLGKKKSEELPEELCDPSYAVALGLINWGFEAEFLGDSSRKVDWSSLGFLGKFTRWLKDFLP